MTRIPGLPVSPGVAWGPAALMLQRHPAMRCGIAAANVERELGRLDRAREASASQLRAIYARVAQRAGADLASLFEAQLLMLDDDLLVPRARRIVESDRVNAEWALDRAFDQFCAVFADVGDEYLRERRGDVADVVGRLRRNLRPAASGGVRVLADLAAPAILVADELAPSFAAQIDPAMILGVAFETGSRTHHSAILARSLGIPAVAGAALVTMHIRPGTFVLVDGDAGEVVIDPTPELVEEARARRGKRAASAGLTHAQPAGPALTADGVAVRFQANIERLEEVEAARAAGAEGIGLFRSEFLLGGRAVDAFDEEAQYGVYRDLAERMAPHPVTIRTFDIDEAQASGRAGSEQADGSRARGPMGLRAIRLSLGHREAFEMQLRALARAGRHGAVRVLLPFVSSVDELRERQGRAAFRHPRRGASRPGLSGHARWRHDRSAVRRLDGRPAGRRGGLLQHRHQRPDSVLPGGRSGRRTGGGAVRPAAPRHSQGHPPRHPARPAARPPGGAVRRDGR